MNYSHDMAGFVYHDELGLVIAGDKWKWLEMAGNGSLKVESTVDGQSFRELKDLGEKLFGQCLVTPADGNLLSLGGYVPTNHHSGGTWRYKVQDDRWDPFSHTARMDEQWHSRGCGMVTDPITGIGLILRFFRGGIWLMVLVPRYLSI